MPNTNHAEAVIIVRRLQSLIRKTKFMQSDQRTYVSACFGIYQMQDELDLTKVIMQADKKLYEKKRSRSKQSGKHR